MLEGPPRELRERQLVFVDDLESPVLRADDLHHLRRSLRRSMGAPLCVADGHGRWRTGTLGADGLEDLGVVHHEVEPDPAVTVGLAIPKGPRLEVAIAKLTEVGVDHIILLAAERSVVRWSEGDVDRRLQRLRRVVREAAVQCRRPRLPTLSGQRSVVDVVAAHPHAVALAEPGGAPPRRDRTVVLVGPEGGWTSAELDACATRVGLGSTILRVETAAIAAGVALCGQRAGWLA